jgi:5-methyltetrahydropteroyltriglutamate--homocysteine methyltransferase
LVSSKSPALESRDDLRRRTHEATQYIGLDRLGISPQCGFASTVAGNPLTEADERAKLRLVARTASGISEATFGYVYEVALKLVSVG